MEYQDITKTGPVGLKGLNYTQPSRESEAFKMNAFRGNIGRWTSTSPALFEPQHRSLDDPLAYLGSSKYDDISAGLGGEMTLNERRFENQSTLDAMGNALAKMLGTAASTIVSGGALIAAGIPTAIAEKRWSGLWDNEVTQALSDFEDYMEDNFKIYQSKEQQEAPWLSVANLTSASFWGDDVIKNAGFMLGAAASGSMFTGGLGMVSKALRLVNSATRATKRTSAVLGSLFSAAGEGAIEARNLYNDTVELNTQRLDDALGKEAEKALAEYEATKGTLVKGADGTYYDPAYEKLQATREELIRKRELGRAEIQKTAREAGNLDMALNIPILTLSNLITLGKGFSKSFSNAAKIKDATNKVAGSSLISGARTSSKELANAYKKFRTEGVVPTIESTLKNTKYGKVGAAIKPIISEGSEEMNQQWASSFSGYFKAYKEDPNDYWKAQVDPASQQKAMSAMTALGKSFGDSWGSYDQWEQFFVGGLTGAVGMPMPTRAFNQDKTKRKYDPRRYFSWEGGSFQNVRDFNKKLQEATVANEAMNARYKDPKFWNRMSSLVAHSYHQATMDEAVANNDIKTFKDSEEKQFVQDLNAFVRAGRLDDFIALTDASTQDLSDADIADLIKKNTAKVSKEQDEINQKRALDLEYSKLQEEHRKAKDAGNENVAERFASDMMLNRFKYANVVGEEKTVGLYTDENGNLTKSVDEIRKELQDNGNKLKERVKEYTESINRINRITQGKLTSDQVGNLAYLDYMGKAARKRANKILDNYSIPKYFILNPSKEETPEIIERVLGLPEGAVTGNSDGTVTVNTDSLSPERQRDLYLDYGLGHDQQSALKNALNIINQDSNIPVNDPKAAQDILDVTKLLFDSKQYFSTFEDYMKNPQRVEEKKAEEEKKADKEIRNSSVTEMEVPEIVRAAEEGTINLDDDFDFDEDDAALLGDESNTKSEGSTVKNKVEAAKEVVNTKREVKSRAVRKSPENAETISGMIDKAGENANSAEELLDLDTEAFNNPDVLPTSEDTKALIEIINNPETSQENREAAQQLLEEENQRRLDDIKNIIEEIRAELAEEKDLMADFPEDGKVVKSWGDEKISGKDPISKTPSVNKEENKEDNNSDDDYIPTPNLEEIPESLPQTSESIPKEYWKPNTSQYPIHRGPEDSVPYYEQIQDPKRKAIYKEIYDFLQNSGVSTRINNNEIKVGQKVRFAISKSLTSSLQEKGGKHTVILLVDENNNIIGDLVSPYDSTIFASYPGLSELYNKAVEHYNKTKDTVEGDLVILPDYETTVSRPYVGRPLFTPKEQKRNTLNEIAAGKKFNIGIAMATGSNPSMIITPGRKKSQGLSSEDLSIMRPATAVAGQPFLLIATSDPNRKWYPVPITMPAYNSNSRYSLTAIINSHIASITLPEKLLSKEEQLKWANELRDLLGIGEVFFEMTKSQSEDGTEIYNITLRIKRRKSDTVWETIYKGEPNSEIYNALNRAKLPYQVSRKYINSTFRGQDYNGLIGEIATTNLPVGALHTVNDFFTLNPIQNGKSSKAKPIENAPKKALESAEANRENSFVQSTILPDQENVDRSKTDSDYYYIKESDGKYHRYERVHKVLPSNSNNTASANSQRGLRTGSAIDTIVRDFFNTGQTTKPDFMSEDSYNSILNYLKTLDKWLKDHKWTVYANNIVLYNKYPDGRRIAGEVDLLLIDDKGNYHIYDVKTSVGSFIGDFYEGVHPYWGQVMSTKDYHSAQVSSYAKLLNDRFGKKVTSVAIIPFNIVYEENNNVIGVTKVPNIALPIVDVDSYFKTVKVTTEAVNSKGEKYKTVEDAVKAVDAPLHDNTQNVSQSSVRPAQQSTMKIIVQGIQGEYEVEVERTPITSKDLKAGDRFVVPKGLGGGVATVTTINEGVPIVTYNGNVRLVDGNFKESIDANKVYRIVPTTTSTSQPTVPNKTDTLEPKTSVNTARENLSNNKLLKSQKWQNRLARLNDDNIEALDKLTRKAPIFKRTIDFLDAKIKDTMSDEDLNNLVAEQLRPKNRETENTNQEDEEVLSFNALKQDIEDFFKNFGITLNDLGEYSSEEPIFDALHRIINFTNVENLTDNVGYAIAFMMQWDPKIRELIDIKVASNNPIIGKSIRRSLKRKGAFSFPHLSDYKYKALDRTPYLKEIGKDIASELRNLYSKHPEKPKGFLAKVMEIIQSFLDKLTPELRTKYNVISGYMNSIANAIKLEDYTIVLKNNIKPGTEEEAQLINIEEALKENPYKESIVNIMSKNGIALAGSASIAAMGTLYRPEENPLHDLDFNTNGKNREQVEEVLKENYPNFEHTNTIQGDDTTTETYLIMDRPFYQKRDVSGLAVYTIYDKKTGEKLGTRVNSDLVLNEGVKGKMLDFFIKNQGGNEVITKVYNGKPYLFSNAREALNAKINWAREKDIWNYNRYIPNVLNGSPTLRNSNREEIKRKLKNANIIWGHPALGKTFYMDTHNDILEWDEEVNDKRNEFIRDQIDPEHRLEVKSPEFKELKSKYMSEWLNHPEYIDFLTQEWNNLKERAKREGKRIFASPAPLMTMFKDDFDLFIVLPEKTFLERNMQRGGKYYSSIGWKQIIDKNLTLINPSKIVYTTEYFSDMMEEVFGEEAYRKMTNEIPSTTINRELELLYTILPQLSAEDRVKIVGSLIKIPNGEAWGQFKDGIITLYRNAAKGTAYHEAFHFVFNSLMTDTEIENAYQSAEKQWGNLSPIELEERMAEDFRRYIQNEETFVGRLKNLWSKLKALLNHFNSNWCYLDRVYSDINKGRYANRNANSNNSFPKYMKVPSVADIQWRVDSLVNNSAVNRTVAARNRAWSNLVDYLEGQGIMVKGYRNKYTWTVTSVRSKAEIDAEAIRAYNESKLSYKNLNQERKDYLRERGITITEYNRMTLTEKETLFECMY